MAKFLGTVFFIEHFQWLLLNLEMRNGEGEGVVYEIKNDEKVSGGQKVSVLTQFLKTFS